MVQVTALCGQITQIFFSPITAIGVAIGTGGGVVVVVASVLILVLCIIKVKKLKVDAARKSMP